MRFVLPLLIFATAASSLKAADSAPAKKLIEFGWDEPDTAFMREHIAEMEATPFDGCVFHVKDFLWETWGKRAFKESDFRASLEDLNATPFKRFTQNFLRFNTTPADVDWF